MLNYAGGSPAYALWYLANEDPKNRLSSLHGLEALTICLLVIDFPVKDTGCEDFIAVFVPSIENMMSLLTYQS
jgi:hypothetical protein